MAEDVSFDDSDTDPDYIPSGQNSESETDPALMEGGKNVLDNVISKMFQKLQERKLGNMQ